MGSEFYFIIYWICSIYYILGVIGYQIYKRMCYMKLDINPHFEQALRIMENTCQHLFITGKAGTGKSTLLECFCANTHKQVVVLAPMGVSALHVKGQTIHKFFNFYIDVTVEQIEYGEIVSRNPEIYKSIDTIIIDEVSMVRADLLDCIDAFMSAYGPQQDTPFGGVQMVFIGDLYQLPPVGKGERQVFRDYYTSPYFFSADVMNDISLDIIELEKVYRQKDADFIKINSK